MQKRPSQPLQKWGRPGRPLWQGGALGLTSPEEASPEADPSKRWARWDRPLQRGDPTGRGRSGPRTSGGARGACADPLRALTPVRMPGWAACTGRSAQVAGTALRRPDRSFCTQVRSAVISRCMCHVRGQRPWQRLLPGLKASGSALSPGGLLAATRCPGGAGVQPPAQARGSGTFLNPVPGGQK